MPCKVLCCLIVAMVLQPVTAAAAGSRVPLAVSPGEIGEVSLVDDRCPTFSWGAVDGAAGYELVVYRVSVDGEDAEPVVHQTIPGAALSWTPSLDRCLERAGRYAWAVRAVGGRVESPWSEERLFSIESALEEADAAVALAVLRRFLDEGGSLEELTATEPRSAPRLGSQPAGGGSSSEAPTAIPIPPPEPIPRHVLGISSVAETAGIDDRWAIATRGQWLATNGLGRAAGYLGVAVGRNSGFDGFPQLRELIGESAGVLGVAGPEAFWGVVGVGAGYGSAGYFFSTDGSGQQNSKVEIGTGSEALNVWGDATFYDRVTMYGLLRVRFAQSVGVLDSSADYSPEVYKITDANRPTCSENERGSIAVMKPSAAGNQDSLCFCGKINWSLDWWCFNP